MSKHIVFCADGTWNEPGQDVNHDGLVDPTNVYKMFTNLKGDLVPDCPNNNVEQEKAFSEGGETRQIAKYLHGVGNSNNPIMYLLGGVFGDGLVGSIVRGYTFISRHYRDGDPIHIIGFSRGAYTARALAGLIVSQGLLAPHLTVDKEQAYQYGIRAWYQYRNNTVSNFASDILNHLEALFTELPAGIPGNHLAVGDLVPIQHLATVAVWDTVGAMGIPLYLWGSDKRIDAFQFDNQQLSKKISHGYHAVSLDERRDDFRPTLWEAEPHVTQRLFPGAHCDVGGGYPAVNNESGLSDGAMDWMMRMLGGGKKTSPLFSEPPGYTPNPDPAGTAHKPWAHGIWTSPIMKIGARHFPDHVLAIDGSITQRQQTESVLVAPDMEPTVYRPDNLPEPI